MTKAAKRISQIAEHLPPERQEVLLEIAEGLALPVRYFDLLTADQLGDLDRSVDEAARGQVVDAATLDARLDKIVSRGDA